MLLIYWNQIYFGLDGLKWTAVIAQFVREREYGGIKIDGGAS